ncbi:MAG: helix-turn-helix domain-containing protein [Oligoflexia bacterium]|nr:helix-turn-helix domain-containing protein [Oligoflexia bacterium]
MAKEKSDLSKSDLERIEDLASKGLSISEIAASLEMSKTTLERRLSDDGTIVRLERGRAKSLEQVASTAYQMATSGNYPAMTMFWLKCQGKWREQDDNPSESEKFLSNSFQACFTLKL